MNQNDEQLKKIKSDFDLIHDLCKMNNISNFHAINSLSHYLMAIFFSLKLPPSKVEEMFSEMLKEYVEQYNEKNKV